ncbi:MAG: DNA replication and repair protein RecF [Gammaproteobacteria bacterium]|nr:DNA replication and repair protein RecF [Gammaproteobacteria bacterium]
MLFTELRVKNVRNISNINIEPCSSINLFTGSNGSGKTALLEAVHVLARARSFRTPRIKEVIQRDRELLQVSAEVLNSQELKLATGIEKTYGQTTIRFDGKAVKTVSEQAKNIPLVFVTPDSQTLITGSPKDRRHWLDWAMFHVEQEYIFLWRDYQTALRNRNNLLKHENSDSQLLGWEKVMSECATKLNAFRQDFIETFQVFFNQALKNVFPAESRVVLNDGSPPKISLEEYLDGSKEQDRKLGYTRFGPHKADLGFLNGPDYVSTVFSRGQIKRFVLALQVSLACSFESINKEMPILLIDEYSAELDEQTQTEVLAQFKEYKGQVFLTAVETSKVLNVLEGSKVFHVERGNVN